MGTKKSKRSAGYQVGYGKPPKHGQIKPGEVRNPYGRNGKTLRANDAFERVMNRKTRVTIDGETIALTTVEAYYMKMTALALGGQVGAARIVQKELHRIGFGSTEQLSAEELAKEAVNQKKKQALSAKIIELLEEKAAEKKKAGERRAQGEYNAKQGIASDDTTK